jgi:sugar transferase EpsL
MSPAPPDPSRSRAASIGVPNDGTTRQADAGPRRGARWAHGRGAAAKRAIDLAGASIGLLVFAVPMAVVALLVRATLGSPVIYRQPRPGLRGRTFDIFKFRTMHETTDASGELLPNRLRVTPLGQFLRRSSLDELPELINVVRGEMSLVGPRPLRVEYLDRYTPEQSRRHDVMPGITGWAQVNGRNALDWNERLALDVWYVDRASFWLDMKILARTVLALVRRTGGPDDADAGLDVPEFWGTVGRERNAFNGVRK